MLQQGGIGSACHWSVSSPLMRTLIRAHKGYIQRNNWTREPESEKAFFCGLRLLLLHACLYRLICNPAACDVPPLLQVPVQSLIDAAALLSSSLSMHLSSAPLFDGGAAIKPKGLSAIQSYLN